MNITPISINKDHYSDDAPDAFPYVIDRLMAAVYLKRKVYFLEKTNKGCFFKIPAGSDKNNFYIDESNAFIDGKITASARKKLIGVVRRASRAFNRRMCVVFSADEAVFFEPDDSNAESTEIPSGGVLFVP